MFFTLLACLGSFMLGGSLGALAMAIFASNAPDDGEPMETELD